MYYILNLTAYFVAFMFELIRAHFNALMGNCISRLCRHNQFPQGEINLPQNVLSHRHIWNLGRTAPLYVLLIWASISERGSPEPKALLN